MSLLLSCQSLAKAHGSRELFNGVSFGILRGDQIGLVGPNGAGKSTLLKILAGIEVPDNGSVSCKSSLRVGYVPQSSIYTDEAIEDVILNAIQENTHLPDYERQTKVAILLSKLGFKDSRQTADTLSGGWKKRLDMAKVLVNDPDILLLDEPTNHLDLEGILWLEEFLQRENIAFLVTSHDRYFLQNVTKKMMELNPVYPQGIFFVEGNYAAFLEKREEFYQYQQKCERSLSSKVRNEVEWLRQTPKARTTKSSARVQSAGKLIQNLDSIKSRNRQSTAKIDFESTDRQTHRLLTVKNLAKSLGGRLLFSDLNLTFTPGMRLGIVGPNGCGKTTLLKLLAQEISPDKGTVKECDGLRIVYFDQHRQKLPEGATLRSALASENDTIIYRGQHIHVNSWAKRFLFSPDRMDLPIKQLSGGELARIHIAKLMLQPADLLLLDEPTNDLDIETLETLEESLMEFPGAIAVISHDRALLDRLTTCVIGLGLPGEPPILADYHQWEAYLKKQVEPQTKPVSKTGTNEISEENKAKTSPSLKQKKLSYKESKELEQIEGVIEELEKKVKNLQETMQIHTDNKNTSDLKTTCLQMEETQKELDRLYGRWQELESKNA